jgi:hypothetical protein
MPSDSSRESLPFEPKRNRKKPEKKPPLQSSPSSKKETQKEDGKKAVSSPKARSTRQEQTQIPEAVSRRMVRRMAFFCGIPTFLGIASFFGSYVIVTQELFPLPNAAVVLVSMGFFGLGVIGLSYGVLSASWDEDTPGGLIGFSEFKTNLGRMTQAWRSARKNS